MMILLLLSSLSLSSTVIFMALLPVLLLLLLACIRVHPYPVLLDGCLNAVCRLTGGMCIEILGWTFWVRVSQSKKNKLGRRRPLRVLINTPRVNPPLTVIALSHCGGPSTTFLRSLASSRPLTTDPVFFSFATYLCPIFQAYLRVCVRSRQDWAEATC